MKSSKFWFYPMFLAALFLFACNNSNPEYTTGEEEQIDSTIATATEEITDTTVVNKPVDNGKANEARPAPKEVKLNADWVAGAAPKLQKWISYHSQSLPNFAIENFVVIDTFLSMEFPEFPMEKTDPGFDSYRITSPDGSKHLDIYSYKKKLKKGKDGKVVPTGTGNEMEVAIYGLNPDAKTRLLFCGAPCHFDDAVWLNNNVIVVAGYSNEINQKDHPMLWRIDLKNASVWRYLYPEKLPDGKKDFINTVVFAQ